MLDDLTGELRLSKHTTNVTAILTVEDDGTTTIRCAPIQLRPEDRWLFDRARAHDGGFLPSWHLRAYTEERDHVSSDHLTIRRHTLGPSEDGTSITLEFDAGRARISHEGGVASAAECSVTYHTVGMHGMGAQHGTTTEGRITLAGDPRPENEDRLVGYLKISAHADEQRPLSEWLTACDERARHVLRIISLADGKNLAWSIRQTKNHDRVVETELYGPRHGSPGRDHIFHHLNLQPGLELAIEKYTPELRADTGIETAIGLFLITSPHLEVQLLIAMTALEHLTSIYKTYHQVPTPLRRDVFATMKRILQRTYDISLNPLLIDRKAAKRVRDKIGTLNQTTFRDDLASMLQEYNVPLDDIRERVASARRARNHLAHRGTAGTDFRTLYMHVLVLRELLKRIFLALLQYKGQYQSFLHGPSWTHFPPT